MDLNDKPEVETNENKLKTPNNKEIKTFKSEINSNVLLNPLYYNEKKFPFKLFLNLSNIVSSVTFFSLFLFLINF